MEQLPSPPPDTRPPWGTRVLAALVLVAWFVLLIGYFAACWDGEQAPFPYVWRDVALVYLLSALPLTMVLVRFLQRGLSCLGSVVLAALCLGASLVPFTEAVRLSTMSAWLSQPFSAALLRAAPALGLALAAALNLPVLLGVPRAQQHAGGWRYQIVNAGVWSLMLMLVPATYVGARCRHDVARLGELLEQARVGEARTLARNLLMVDARLTWQGRSLPQVAAQIDRIARNLESQVAAPLPLQPTAEERLERARRLAMLGRTTEALDTLSGVRELGMVPEVDNLRGTIHETRSEWETALGAYRNARVAWEAQRPSRERTAGLVRATTGVAYCQRKQGRYAEAEASYQQMLALSPTADTHFLLAQFYEDAQQADQARSHARRAMALSPTQYQQEGEKLIRKLTVFHFGCLSVYTAENERPNLSFPMKRGIGNP